MSTRPLFISTGIMLAIAAGIFATERQHVVPASMTASVVEIPHESVVASAPTRVSSAATSTPVSPAETATFKIPERSYTVAVTANETVLTLMNALKASGAITFTVSEYPSLGTFIDSLNGEKNGGGTYWVYSVNGTEASYGVSTQIVRAGDVIEWKYGTSY